MLESLAGDQLDSKLWMELVRLKQALLETAQLVDRVNYVPPDAYGVVNAQQFQTTVSVIAAEAIPSGRFVKFLPTGGGIRAYSNASQFYPRAEGFASQAVTAGALGTFILRGYIYFGAIPPIATTGTPGTVVRGANGSLSVLGAVVGEQQARTYLGYVLGFVVINGINVTLIYYDPARQAWPTQS